MTWSLRPATVDDLEDLAELRAVVMRPDLERLGRYDPHRVQQRLRDAYTPQHTRIIEIDSDLAGSITLRPAAAPDPQSTPGAGRGSDRRADRRTSPGADRGADRGDGVRWLEHFYLAPRHQGRGVGSAVLRSVLEQAGTDIWLNVLQGSPARKLYERHGFVVASEDPVDVFMVRDADPQAITIS
ncbi:GNAT family N-acetyltransferase [Kribbella sp. NPDC048928]|uniref:GNAT family N-acetyltransferase n=1 Tax=Kribbella sp. NPDC048928 TaxID=3364111 RepID=UPI003721EF83